MTILNHSYNSLDGIENVAAVKRGTNVGDKL